MPKLASTLPPLPYEERGLLEAARGGNGYRFYRGGVVTTVRQIRRLLDMGMTTSVFKQVLRCASGELPELNLCPDAVVTPDGAELGAVYADLIERAVARG